MGIVERELWPWTWDAELPLSRVPPMYGLLCFFLEWALSAWPLRLEVELLFASVDEMFLKFASFFIQDEKGLRRPGRSESWSASSSFAIGMRKG